MQNDESQPQKKPIPLHAFWPDVKTEKGMKDAVKAGAFTFAYIAFSYALSTAYTLFAGRHLVGALEDNYELIGVQVLNVVMIIMASVLAWLLLKQQSLVVAAIGLAWIVAEVAMKMMHAPGQGVVIAIIALLFSINGVRGTLAAKRKSEQPPVQA